MGWTSAENYVPVGKKEKRKPRSGEAQSLEVSESEDTGQRYVERISVGGQDPDQTVLPMMYLYMMHVSTWLSKGTEEAVGFAPTSLILPTFPRERGPNGPLHLILRHLLFQASNFLWNRSDSIQGSMRPVGLSVVGS